MISIKRLPSNTITWVIAIASLAYVSWLVIGIKFQNHDDIYYHLYAYVTAGDLLSFSEITARQQARVQAFLNMPIILWADGAQGSLLFDITAFLNVACLFISIFYFLSALTDRQSAILLGGFTALVFPLHYYFTFPQGYPVMGSYGLMLGLIAAGMLASQIKKPNKIKSLTSIIIFTISLWGPEYNFILHPALLLIVAFNTTERKNLKEMVALGWPYALGWLISISIYLTFSIISRDTGGDANGRVTFALDLSSWLKTFLVLQEKAYLPIGLIKGISIIAEGVPNIPSALDYLNIWSHLGGRISGTIIFLMFLAAAFAMLHAQKLNQKSLIFTSAALLIIAVIPALVLSASAHYQEIVLNGWIQGHLVTFYSHLGISGLVFLASAYVVNALHGKARFASIFTISIMLAAYGTITFAYNNVNRNIMMTNSQKWDAMKLIASFTRTDRPDLKESVFYAPDFWTTNGVSAIPRDSLFNNENYWTLYAKSVLGEPIHFASAAEKIIRNGVLAEYLPTLDGSPLVVLREIKNNTFSNLTLVSSKPITGVVFNKKNGLRLKEITRSDWACSQHCTTLLKTTMPASDFVTGFQFIRADSNGLLSQFLTGESLAPPSDLNLLKIENWGPNETIVGVVPNPQPDGTSGVWIKLGNGYFYSGLQLLVDGQPALSTTVHKAYMTASIDPKIFSTAGKKRLEIFSLTTGSTILVGEMDVK